jgi:hypothetical protein
MRKCDRRSVGCSWNLDATLILQSRVAMRVLFDEQACLRFPAALIDAVHWMREPCEHQIGINRTTWPVGLSGDLGCLEVMLVDAAPPTGNGLPRRFASWIAVRSSQSSSVSSRYCIALGKSFGRTSRRKGRLVSAPSACLGEGPAWIENRSGVSF